MYLLKECHRLEVLWCRVLKTVLHPKREVLGGLRKLHNEKFHSLLSTYTLHQVLLEIKAMNC